MPVPANALRGLFWCIVIDLGLAGVIWALIVAWHYLPQICSLLFACLGWGPAIAAPLLIDNETRHI
jgi:hypothetical protein